MTMKDPPHPGLSVRHDCIEPLGLTITEAEMAEAAEADPRRRDTPPVLGAVRVGSTLAVVCPYCGRQHTHGVGDGPREPHCGAPTGLHRDEQRPELPPYVLVEEPPPTREAER